MVKFGLLTCEGSSLVAPLVEKMAEFGLRPAAIFTDGAMSVRDREIERQRLLPSFVFRSLADIKLDAPVYAVDNHNSDAAIGLYRSAGIDFLVNAGTPRILKEKTLASVRGVVNCHPGILPKYRGCMCVEWSIYNDDPVGATTHFMSGKIDEGPIIYAAAMKVNPGEDYLTVRTHMLSHQVETLARGLAWVEKNPQAAEKLPPQGEGTYHKPMAAEQFEEVKRKLVSGHYRSQ